MASIGFIGAGNMGGAIARGLSLRKDVKLFGFDLDREKLGALAGETGMEPTSSLPELVKHSEFILLAVKPQHLEQVVRDTAELLSPDKCLISIAAGITSESIRQWAGSRCPVVRVMPNTPALAGSGVFALCLDDPALPDEKKEQIRLFFEGQGNVHIIPESLFDGFTAVIGSGPAYVIYFMEALIDAAVTLGIPRNAAADMVVSLFDGSVDLIRESGRSLASLREMVCSPGGSTIAGLNHFDRRAVRGALIDGVLQAFARNKELGE
ncbi:MAG: pyrroline-5-carboxylate reductase [Desulfovibrionales bacterium]